ncbi:hypothetical protein [Mycoplasmopsis bovirhinis]|uniref:F5/8 type C domain-containing protein n=1 Tax=Mycoplasmopsis bovirhinis TaxID=29553 RepID=A0A449ADJ9_9BACT|nr:hypothetical protein [Mycoplasmopsis bovirhinis]VEU63053.1 Uncharacterised protein [Mycoplasmopsis bovirhinis]
MRHFVTGKKGATTLSSLPAYDNSKQDWWKVDTTNPTKITGNSKNDSSSNTNTVTYHLVERSSGQSASNATYEQSRIKAIATMTLIDADSTSTNGSNHVDRNPYMIQNLKVDKERSGKNFDKEKLGTYLTDGDIGEAKRIEQWEHVGLDLDNKLVFYKTNNATQSQSDSTNNTEAVEAEWSKVELYLRTSGSQKNFGLNYNHTIPKQFKLFYSQDGEQWTPVSNQSHQHYYDFVQINSFDLPSGFLNIEDNSIPSGSRTFTNNDKDKFFIRIANNVSAFAIEFKPVKAKYMKVEWVSARNELTKENVSQNQHANGRYFKNNDTLQVGSTEWQSYFKSNAPEEKKSKVTGDLDHAFVEVKFFSPSAEHNPYKKCLGSSKHFFPKL